MKQSNATKREFAVLFLQNNAVAEPGTGWEHSQGLGHLFFEVAAHAGP